MSFMHLSRPKLPWFTATIVALLLHLLLALGVYFLSFARPPAQSPKSSEFDELHVSVHQPQRATGLIFISRPIQEKSDAAAQNTKHIPAEATEHNPGPTPFDPVFVETPPAMQTVPPATGNAMNSVQQPKLGAGGVPKSKLFAISKKATRVVFVVDRSSSMGGNGAFPLVRRELANCLVSLPEAVSFCVILFSSSHQNLLHDQAGFVPATIANKQRALAALAHVDAAGQTNHRDALPAALSLAPDVIYFLTDADDLSLSYVQRITRLNRGRAVIHAIELNTAHRGLANMPLQVLARGNGGTYQAIDHRRTELHSVTP